MKQITIILIAITLISAASLLREASASEPCELPEPMPVNPAWADLPYCFEFDIYITCMVKEAYRQACPERFPPEPTQAPYPGIETPAPAYPGVAPDVYEAAPEPAPTAAVMKIEPWWMTRGK